MVEYEIAKEIIMLREELEELKGLVAQVYGVVDYNLKNKKLEEPKPKKE